MSSGPDGIRDRSPESREEILMTEQGYVQPDPNVSSSPLVWSALNLL